MERADTLAEGVELAQRGCILLPAGILFEGMGAAVDAWLRDAARDGRGGGDVHAVNQGQVANDVGRAADGAVGADAGGARHCRTARHGRVAADVHVVGDLDEVVELDAVLDDRVGQGAAVDAGVGADLDVVADGDVAELLDLYVAVLAGCQAKAIRTDDHAAVHQPASPYAAAIAQHDPGRQARVGAHLGAALDDAVRADAGPVTDDGAGLDDGQRADGHIPPERRLRRHDGAGMHAHVGRRAGAGGPPLREAGEVQIRVGRDDGGTPRRSSLGLGRRHDDAGGPRGGELRLVARVGEETDAVAVRLVQRRDAADARFGPTKQIAAQGGDQLSERDGRRAHGGGRFTSAR